MVYNFFTPQENEEMFFNCLLHLIGQKGDVIEVLLHLIGQKGDVT